MKKLVGFAAGKPKALLMAWAAVLLLGASAAGGMPVDYLPDVAVPTLVVSASFPGMPAEEMRALVAMPLEEALSSVKGQTRIASVSAEGKTTIVVDFAWGEPLLAASLRAAEAVDAAYPSLPEGAAKPMILPFDPAESATLIVAVRNRSGDNAASRRFAEYEAKTRFQQAAGVGSVILVGGTEREILVSVDPERAAARGVGAARIAEFLSGENVDYPAGLVREGELELPLRATGKATTRAGLALLRVPTQGGGFPLGDVATIGEGDKERESVFALDGKEWTALEVTRRKGSSPLEASASARAAIEELRADFGRDYEIVLAHDESSRLAATIGSVVEAIGVGALIAFLVLVLFTRNLAASLILVSVMPVSIVAALAALRMAGCTANLMLLGGFSLGIGMITDNAVVALEHLLSRFRGRDRVDGGEIAEAMGEVSGAMFGSTLTAIIVFAPVMLLPGALGALFSDLSLALIFSIFMSWLSGTTLVPALFRLLFPFLRKARMRAPAKKGIYARGLGAAFRRPLVAALAAVALSVAGLATALSLRVEFMPEGDSDRVEVKADFPPGTAPEPIAAYASALTGTLRALPGIEAAWARAGGEKEDYRYQSSASARDEELTVEVAFSPDRYAGSAGARKAIEAALAGFAPPGGLRPSIALGKPASAIERVLGFSAAGRTVAVSGATSAEARSNAAAFASLLGAGKEGSPFASVGVSPSGTRPELRVLPDREALAAKGLGFADIAGALSAAVEGRVATSQREAGREVEVRVKDSRRYSEAGIGGIVAANAKEGSIPLAAVARLERTESAPETARLDRRDVAYVEASPLPGRSAEADAAIARAMAERFPGGLGASMAEGSAFESNSRAIAIAALLVVALLYLALGAQFESFSLPLLLLCAIPLSFGGVGAALAALGYSINYGSALGLIVLFGVSVNNSILLWDQSSRRFAAALAARDAIPAGELRELAREAAREGALSRLRPIVMTALTSTLALLPVLFSRAELAQKAMSAALLGGFAASTALTLLVAPLLFSGRLARAEAARRKKASRTEMLSTEVLLTDTPPTETFPTEIPREGAPLE